MSSKLERLRQLRNQLSINVSGRENINSNELYLFVSNHNSLMDIFYLPMAVDVPIADMISSRLMYKKVLDRQKMVNDYLYAMPVEAHGGKVYSNMCLKSGATLLASGINVGIFPEGAYLSEDDVVYRGRTGATRMLYAVKNMGIDPKLVPVAIQSKGQFHIDSYEIDDRNVDVKILEPVDYHNSYENFLLSNNFQDKNYYLHEPIDVCMRNIAESLNRSYDNNYIELFPKGNVIFSDGSTVLTSDAQDEKYVSLYKKDLDERVKVLQKEISNIPKVNRFTSIER